jgi:hypothetical protein
MPKRLGKLLTYGAIGGVVVVGLLQIAPVKWLGIPTQDIGNNPPQRFKLDAPPEVEVILRRACYDCHSNETRWPIYSRIAPGSWLMARDIHNGRSHLNFSKWADVDEDEKQDDRESCWEQIESGAMPKWFYVFPFHPDAKLSDADKALLKSYFAPKGTSKSAKAENEKKKD